MPHSASARAGPAYVALPRMALPNGTESAFTCPEPHGVGPMERTLPEHTHPSRRGGPPLCTLCRRVTLSSRGFKGQEGASAARIHVPAATPQQALATYNPGRSAPSTNTR